MKRQLFYCPNCKSFYSKGTDNPNEKITCEECKSLLVYSGMSKEEWDTKAKEEKDVIKTEFAKKYNESKSENMSTDNAILFEVQKIRKDVHTMSSIVLFLFVVMIIEFLGILILGSNIFRMF